MEKRGSPSRGAQELLLRPCDIWVTEKFLGSLLEEFATWAAQLAQEGEGSARPVALSWGHGPAPRRRRPALPAGLPGLPPRRGVPPVRGLSPPVPPDPAPPLPAVRAAAPGTTRSGRRLRPLPESPGELCPSAGRGGLRGPPPGGDSRPEVRRVPRAGPTAGTVDGGGGRCGPGDAGGTRGAGPAAPPPPAPPRVQPGRAPGGGGGRAPGPGAGGRPPEARPRDRIPERARPRRPPRQRLGGIRGASRARAGGPGPAGGRRDVHGLDGGRVRPGAAAERRAGGGGPDRGAGGPGRPGPRAGAPRSRGDERAGGAR